VYDVSAQRRPVLDMTWDEYPITAMCLFRDNQVIVGNTQGSMALLDIRTGKLVHKFKGFAGSIRSIRCHESQPVVASCGLDRFVRLHDVNSKQMLYKKYMKSRLNCLLLTKLHWQEMSGNIQEEDVSEDVKGLDDEDEDNDDAIWDQMEVVQTKTKKRTLETDRSEEGVVGKKKKKKEKKVRG